MFNFLFDGTISSMGERLVNYAAPVHSVTQQYQLAIQHHRNDEVNFDNSIILDRFVYQVF